MDTRNRRVNLRIQVEHSLLAKQTLRQHRVDALGAVDIFRDDEIQRGAAQEVGVIACHAKLVDNKGHHLTGSQFRSDIQIRIETDGHVVRGRFAARPLEIAALVQDHLYLALE